MAETLPTPVPAGGPLAPWLVAGAYRLLSRTWRYRFVDRAVFDDALHEGATILAFWHGEQLPMVAIHGGLGLAGMASTSRDGELLARVIQRFGYTVIRGSSSRGASRALRESVAAIRAGRSPALAIDGPRGPYHQPQQGAVALSALTGRPIVYVVSVSRPALRLGSWDRFVVPAPFARVVIGYGRMPPPGRAALDRASASLRDRMEALAERISGSTSR